MRFSHAVCMGLLGIAAAGAPPTALFREKVVWNGNDDGFMKIDSKEFRQGFIVPLSIVLNDGVQTRTTFVESSLTDLSCVTWSTDNVKGERGFTHVFSQPYNVAPSEVRTHSPSTVVYRRSDGSSGAGATRQPLLYAPNPRGIIQYVSQAGTFVTPAPPTPAPLGSEPATSTLQQIFLRFGGTALYHPQFSEILTVTLNSGCFEGELPTARTFQIHVGAEDTYDEDHVKASEGIVIAAMGASLVGGDPFEASQFASILSDNCREGQKLIFVLHPIGEDILKSSFIGCIVYNGILTAGGFALHGFFILILTWLKGRHLRTEASFLRFPGGTIKFAIFLSQGILLSAWVLIWTHGDTRRMALPLGIGCIFFIGIILPVWLFFKLSSVRRFAIYDAFRGEVGLLTGEADWYPKEIPEGKDIIKEAKVFSAGHELSTKEVRKEFKRTQMLFDDYTPDAVKFICIKSVVAFLFYMIHSMNSTNIPNDYRDCGHIRIATMCLFVIYMAFLILMKPFRVFSLFVVEMFITLSKAIALAFMAAGFYDGNRDHWAFVAGALVVNIGSIVFAIYSVVRFIVNLNRYKALEKEEKAETEKDSEAPDEE